MSHRLTSLVRRRERASRLRRVAAATETTPQMMKVMMGMVTEMAKAIVDDVIVEGKPRLIRPIPLGSLPLGEDDVEEEVPLPNLVILMRIVWDQNRVTLTTRRFVEVREGRKMLFLMVE